MTDFAGANRLKDIPITKTQRSKKQQTWWTLVQRDILPEEGRGGSNLSALVLDCCCTSPMSFTAARSFSTRTTLLGETKPMGNSGYFWISGFLGSDQHVTGCSNLLNLWIGCNTEFCILAFPSSPPGTTMQEEKSSKKKKKKRTASSTKLITLLCTLEVS